MDKYDLADEYSRQPVNWGRDDYDTQCTAYDAFVAGYEAALRDAAE